MYINGVAKLSSEYGFEAAHPMVVNPCSRAIVQGYDLRTPYGIEVKVRGNQIRTVAME